MKKHIQQFLTYCKIQKNLSEKTLKAYQADLNQFRVFQEREGCDYTDKELFKIYLQELSAEYKVSTIKRKVASIKAFFSYLEFEDRILLNPCRKVKINLKEPITLPRTLTFQEIELIFSWLYAQKGDTSPNKDLFRRIVRDIAVIELLFYTGMRVAELCGIRREDIDLNDGVVRVKGKGNRERLLFIGNGKVLAALKEYYALYYSEISQGDFFLSICAGRNSRNRVYGFA